MVGGAPAMVGAIGTCGDVGGVAAVGWVPPVPECETPTTSQALKATSARAHAKKLKVLFNAPYFRRPAAPRFPKRDLISDVRSTEAQRWRMTVSLGKLTGNPAISSLPLETGGFASPPCGGFAYRNTTEYTTRAPYK
jgi:hypothetical protein